MKYYTLDDITALEPCYSRKELEVYMKGRKRISLSGMLNSKASDDDKVWLVTRLLSADAIVEFTQWCADSVSHIDNIYDAEVDADSDPWAAAAYASVYGAARDAVKAAYKDADSAADAARTARVEAANAAGDAYNKARKNQVNQLKLIVKEHKL